MEDEGIVVVGQIISYDGPCEIKKIQKCFLSSLLGIRAFSYRPSYWITSLSFLSCKFAVSTNSHLAYHSVSL